MYLKRRYILNKIYDNRCDIDIIPCMVSLLRLIAWVRKTIFQWFKKNQYGHINFSREFCTRSLSVIIWRQTLCRTTWSTYFKVKLMLRTYKWAWFHFNILNTIIIVALSRRKGTQFALKIRWDVWDVLMKNSPYVTKKIEPKRSLFTIPARV